MKPATLYLDTSVVGGYFDDEWQGATRELWRQMEEGRWRFFSSDVTVREMEGAPEEVRELFERAFRTDTLFEVTLEMEELAEAYLRQGVVPARYADDAQHVAVCTVARIDYLVSWNFKHLVNVQREAGFNAVNLLQRYPPVHIVNPLELIHGNQDQEV